jgi:hypothetical protein
MVTSIRVFDSDVNDSVERRCALLDGQHLLTVGVGI